MSGADVDVDDGPHLTFARLAVACTAGLVMWAVLIGLIFLALR